MREPPALALGGSSVYRSHSRVWVEMQSMKSAHRRKPAVRPSYTEAPRPDAASCKNGGGASVAFFPDLRRSSEASTSETATDPPTYLPSASAASCRQPTCLPRYSIGGLIRASFVHRGLRPRNLPTRTYPRFYTALTNLPRFE